MKIVENATGWIIAVSRRMGEAWQRVVNIYNVATDKRRPAWSLREVWSSEASFAANSLRAYAEILIDRYPNLKPSFVMGAMNNPPSSGRDGCRSIFSRVIQNPKPEYIARAQLEIRENVKSMSEVIADVRSL